MGKKRVAKKSESNVEGKSKAQANAPRKKIESGTLYVEATYNNTKLNLTDREGNTLCWSSSGSLGYKGARKGTPFAAAKVGEIIGEKAGAMGMRAADVVVIGVGAGRESSIRGFVNKANNISLTAIMDKTPIPHNGPKLRKPRRV